MQRFPLPLPVWIFTGIAQLGATPDMWLKGCEFESPGRSGGIFFLQSSLSVLTLIRCAPCYRSGTWKKKKTKNNNKNTVILQEGPVAGYSVTPKHAYALDATKSEWPVQCCPGIVCELIRETSSHATRQETLGDSRLSSLNHCGLIMA